MGWGIQNTGNASRGNGPSLIPCLEDRLVMAASVLVCYCRSSLIFFTIISARGFSASMPDVFADDPI